MCNFHSVKMLLETLPRCYWMKHRMKINAFLKEDLGGDTQSFSWSDHRDLPFQSRLSLLSFTLFLRPWVLAMCAFHDGKEIYKRSSNSLPEELDQFAYSAVTNAFFSLAFLKEQLDFHMSEGKTMIGIYRYVVLLWLLLAGKIIF